MITLICKAGKEDIHDSKFSSKWRLKLQLNGIFKCMNSPFLLQAKETPLHLAAACGHHEICNMLLEKGADIHALNTVSATFSCKTKST